MLKRELEEQRRPVAAEGRRSWLEVGVGRIGTM